MAERILTVVKDFERLDECLNTSELDIFALNQFNALIQQRIFTFSKAVDDSSFGTYRSESYKKKRKEAGFENKIKNLQFSNELRNDLDLGVYNGKNALGFATERSANIVKGQEEGSTNPKSGLFVPQIQKDIFSANQEEVDTVFEKFDAELDRIIAECLRI